MQSYVHLPSEISPVARPVLCESREQDACVGRLRSMVKDSRPRMVGWAALRRQRTAFHETPKWRGGNKNTSPHGLTAMSSCNPHLCVSHRGGFNLTTPWRGVCERFAGVVDHFSFRLCFTACVSPHTAPHPGAAHPGAPLPGTPRLGTPRPGTPCPGSPHPVGGRGVEGGGGREGPNQT